MKFVVDLLSSQRIVAWIFCVVSSMPNLLGYSRAYAVVTPASLSAQQEAHMRDALQRTIDQTSHVSGSSANKSPSRFVNEWCDTNCKRCELQGVLKDNRTSQWYIVDLNNDGIVEYVYATTWDNWNLVLYIARINKNGTLTFLYKELEIPTHHAWPFYNKITQQSELFVCINGIYYLCFSGIGRWHEEYKRDIYSWCNDIEPALFNQERDKAWSWCCNKDCITHQRALFQALYDRGDYWGAYSLLHDFEAECRGKINPSSDFWMRCDLALAALKCGYPRKSLVILEALQKDLPTTGLSPKLCKAIEFNKAQAEKLQHDEQQGKRIYDARWLLTKISADRSNTIFCDERIRDLLRATVPDVAAWGGIEIWGNNDLEHEEPWRSQLFPHRPWSGGNTHVTCNRFITLACIFGGLVTSGAYGLLWCDIQEQCSIIVVKLYGDEDPIYLTSKTFLADELPDEFYATLVSWIQEEKIEQSLVFIDRLGARHNLTPKELKNGA